MDARHIIIKMSKVKDKERILKAATEKKLVICRGVPISLSANFSKESFQARRDWQEIFSHERQGPKMLYPAKLSLRIKEQRKSFPEKKQTN